MAANIRFPAMPAGTPEEQLQVLYRYLYQLTEQLNVELDRVGDGGISQLERALASGSEPSKNTASKSLVDSYNQLKALIIKTATEVDASTRQIVFDMTDEYRAQSEYGTYAEYLNNEISLGADGVLMNWSAENGITTPVGDFGGYQAKSSVYMQLGIVQYNEDGTVEAGVIIGKDLQRVTVDGKELVRSGNIYCLLKADSLSFWQNGVKLSEYGLYDFFANKAYIGEVYTGLLSSPDFGTSLILQDGVMKAISTNAIVARVKAGSTVEINKDKVEISTPEFRVNTPGAFFTIPSAEDGAPVVEIDDDGLTAERINVRRELKAPNIREIIADDCVYTVGDGCDFHTLQEAFDAISNKDLVGDVVLKLHNTADQGGTVRGIGGSGELIVAPVNLLNSAVTAAITDESATLYSMGYDGFYLKAKSAGALRRSAFDIGHIGTLGVRGKKLTLRCTMYSGSVSDPAYPHIRVYCGKSHSTSSHIASLTRDSSVAANSWTVHSVTFTVPDTASDDDILWMRFHMSSDTPSVTTTAVAYFRNPIIEIGNAINTGNVRTAAVSVNEIRVEGCQARTYMHGLVFVDGTAGKGLAVRDGNVSVNRCTFKSENGFRLWGGSGAMYNCYGACTKAADARGGGAIEIFGSAPTGTKTGLVDTSNMATTTPPAGDEVVTQPATVEIKAKATGTYSGSAWWTSDAAMRQGWTSTNHTLRGAVIFDLSSLSGKTVSKAVLRIKRVEGYGKGGDVDVKIYRTNITSLSGAPTKYNDAFVDGKMAPGETKSFDVTEILRRDNLTKAFVLQADDSSVMSGKTYSTNYARFAGTGSEKNMPVLTVTYK